MKTLEVTIRGESPILFHNSASMKSVGPKSRRQARPSSEEEARASAYFCEDGTLGFPGANLSRAMLAAASGQRVGKQALRPYLAGGVIPTDELFSFGVKTYEIDLRRVVVQRSAIIRSRARLPKGWTLTFRLDVDDSVLPLEGCERVIPDLFVEAGRRVGIGDYRPEKSGPFGRFSVVNHKWI